MYTTIDTVSSARGIYLLLIATNCVVLAVPLINIESNFSFGKTDEIQQLMEQTDLFNFTYRFKIGRNELLAMISFVVLLTVLMLLAYSQASLYPLQTV